MAKFAGLAKNGRERPFSYLSALIKTGEGFANKSLCILPPPLPAVEPVFSAAAVPCIPPLPQPVRELPSHHCHSPCIPATVVQPEPCLSSD